MFNERAENEGQNTKLVRERRVVGREGKGMCDLQIYLYSF